MRYLVIVALCVTGCGKPDDSYPPQIVVRNTEGPDYFVREVVLKDGTRCVVSSTLRMDGGTGIACDWKSSRDVER